MESKLLPLMNKTMYPAESEMLGELGTIFEQLGFITETLQEDSDTFMDELKKYIHSMEKEIDCKAVITCNAAEIEKISEMPDCMYISFLGKSGGFYKYEEKLKCGNQNTVIICQDQQQTAYLKELY